MGRRKLENNRWDNVLRKSIKKSVGSGWVIDGKGGMTRIQRSTPVTDANGVTRYQRTTFVTEIPFAEAAEDQIRDLLKEIAGHLQNGMPWTDAVGRIRRPNQGLCAVDWDSLVADYLQHLADPRLNLSKAKSTSIN